LNFKFTYLFVLALFFSCGVKGPPQPPVGSKIHSIIEEHTEETNTQAKQKSP